MEPSTTTLALENVGRHLKGWQLAVVALGTALCGVALALPRPVAPRELPLPAVDRGAGRERHARARALVQAAATTPLPFLVRAAGEAFRHFGSAEAAGEVDETAAREFRARVGAALMQHGAN